MLKYFRAQLLKQAQVRMFSYFKIILLIFNFDVFFLG